VKKTEVPDEVGIKTLVGLLISEQLYSKERQPSIRHRYPGEIDHLMNAKYRALVSIERLFNNLDNYEEESERKVRRDIGAYGSTNGNVIRLKQMNANQREIEELLSNSYACSCFDIDFEIEEKMIGFYANNNEEYESQELIKTIAVSSIFLEYNLKRLMETYQGIYELLLRVWHRNITTTLAMDGKRNSVAEAIISGGWSFFSYVSSLGIFSGIETISYMAIQHGTTRIAEIELADTIGQTAIIESIKFIKKFVLSNGIGHFAIPRFDM
jgi:hypothetical protein